MRSGLDQVSVALEETLRSVALGGKIARRVIETCLKKKKKNLFNYLAVQRLGICAPHMRAQIQSLVRKLKSHKPRGMANKKIICCFPYVQLGQRVSLLVAPSHSWCSY